MKWRARSISPYPHVLRQVGIDGALHDAPADDDVRRLQVPHSRAIENKHSTEIGAWLIFSLNG